MTENKYQNGKIYKFWSSKTDEIYVGSTCQPLHKRMYKHRCCAMDYNRTMFKVYREMNRIGVDSFNIELIENYPCDSKDELNKREGYWVRELNATLNKQIPGRTKQRIPRG